MVLLRQRFDRSQQVSVKVQKSHVEIRYRPIHGHNWNNKRLIRSQDQVVYGTHLHHRKDSDLQWPFVRTGQRTNVSAIVPQLAVVTALGA